MIAADFLFPFFLSIFLSISKKSIYLFVSNSPQKNSVHLHSLDFYQVSKESVRSQSHLSPHSLNVQQHIPPVLITSSPNSGSRIIRQSSQPEASNVICCAYSCGHVAPNMSLRQLRDPADGIAGIAADSLRINGAMRPFRQVCRFEL